MSRVCTGEPLGQGLALSWGQVREGRVEVGLVLPPDVLGFEQQDQLGRQVRDAVFRVVDDLPIGKSDALIAATDPGVAVVGSRKMSSR